MDISKTLTVNNIDDNTLEGDFTISGNSGTIKAKYTRIKVDYSASILGTWEGVAMTGDETYGNVNHRWEYKTDGTFVYYDKDGDNWVPSVGTCDEYCVDGDLLLTRWKDNAAATTFDYESWIITSCTATEMTWYALREKSDGSRHTTTMTMKRVTE